MIWRQLNEFLCFATIELSTRALLALVKIILKKKRKGIKNEFPFLGSKSIKHLCSLLACSPKTLLQGWGFVCGVPLPLSTQCNCGMAPALGGSCCDPLLDAAFYLKPKLKDHGNLLARTAPCIWAWETFCSILPEFACKKTEGWRSVRWGFEQPCVSGW